MGSFQMKLLNMKEKWLRFRVFLYRRAGQAGVDA